MFYRNSMRSTLIRTVDHTRTSGQLVLMSRLMYLPLLLRPDREVEYCNERVCLCVCLSAIISSELHIRCLPIFCACFLWPWLSLPVAVYLIHYVLLVLWMMSYLLISHQRCSTSLPAEAQCTCSLGLGYKLCAVIPVAGQWMHRTTFRALKISSQVATPGAESAV